MDVRDSRILAVDDDRAVLGTYLRALDAYAPCRPMTASRPGRFCPRFKSMSFFATSRCRE